MIEPFRGHRPKIAPTAFIDPTACIIGDVEIGEYSSVWFGSVVRGDVNYIKIGYRTNVQDLSVLHVTRETWPLVVGNDVTVGHRVILHGCTIGDRSLIGMGAIVMDGAVVGEESIIGAGAVVIEETVIPPGSLALGIPAKVIRPVMQREREFLEESSRNYVQLAQEYLKERTR